MVVYLHIWFIVLRMFILKCHDPICLWMRIVYYWYLQYLSFLSFRLFIAEMYFHLSLLLSFLVLMVLNYSLFENFFRKNSRFSRILSVFGTFEQISEILIFRFSKSQIFTFLTFLLKTGVFFSISSVFWTFFSKMVLFFWNMSFFQLLASKQTRQFVLFLTIFLKNSCFSKK